MKSKLTLMLTPLLVLCMSFSFGQEKTISGNVTDQNGLPLPGVSVVVVGTTSGTQTDFDGNYTISANEGQVLRFSYLGQRTVNRTVGSSDTISIQMEEDAQALDEVVVVGYGTTTKEAFVGTAAVVEAENLDAKSNPNIAQALTGEVAGLTVVNTSGQPGNASTIRIRGYGSVNGNRNPLYVVDGVPFTVPRVPNSDVGDDDDEQTFANTISPLNSINPQDIASVTVLKDATATAIYGSRGANGVIVITTKKGRSGDATIEVDFKTGFNSQLIPRYDVLQSPEEYIGYTWEGKFNRGVATGEADPVAFANATLFDANAGIDPGYNLWNVNSTSELIDPETRTVRPGVTRKYTPEKYADLSFQAAIRTEGNVRMSGGNEKTSYYVSAGFLDDNGYALNTGFERYNTRLNLTSQIKDWLKVGSNITYSYSESQNNGQTVGSENLFEFADKNPPIYPVFLRDNDGNLVPDPIFGGFQYDFGSPSGFRDRNSANLLNPVASAVYDFLGSRRHDMIGNFSAEINLAEGLVFETRYGVQFANDIQKSYGNPFYGTAVQQGGTLFQREQQDVTTNFLQLLRYNKNFGNHGFDALIAHESNDYTRNFSSGNKRDVAVPGLLELDNFAVTQGQPVGFSEGATLESYFSQVNYNYNSTYFLSGSVRTDGSSRFINDKWGVFWSIGGSWIASNESFLENSKLFSYLKLKASYGVIGDQEGIDFYQSDDTFNVTNLNDGLSISERRNGNPDLTWEESKMFQTGVELSLGRFLDVNVDYYRKNTENLFFDRRVGSSQGISTVTVNDGELRNTGLEFSLTAHLIQTENAKLDLTINGEHIDNEIVTMPLWVDPQTQELVPRPIDASPPLFAYSRGSSIFDFYLREYAGVDPETGVMLWNEYFNDANGNGTLDDGEESIADLFPYTLNNPDATIASQTTTRYADATLKYVDKSAIPTLRGAFRLAGSYKNFSLAAQFTYQFGGWAHDTQYSELMNDRFGAGSNNFHTDISRRWQQPGDITDVPRISDGFDQNIGSSSTRWLIKSDFIALNNVRLGYQVPTRLLSNTGLQNINVWVSGDNLYIGSKRDGFNPTTSETGNTGRRLYAPLSTVTMGVSVKF
ncbi:TonB-dependent receptor SusC [Flagellimonas maritima]|uniref:TonB-dependent receptor SusC n=1 Tax=Flagellimonas maritima TaxID=1383885 RepID=A0A2Z4LRN2_9FLAO|nr:SusC/RagA family TonB-linked outer membrane protein [Allomuricauda aurantiaca]AWX43897.1 TonB-dependent receptor SusC [Allomuricauda aurantiaca]